MYNHYLNSHFEGCLLLARSYDEHRKREVQIFLLPTTFDLVGVSDGTDTWLAPVVADPFRLSIKTVLESVRDGTFKEAASTTPRRRIFVPAPGAQADAMSAPTSARIKMVGTQPEAKTARRRIINV